MNVLKGTWAAIDFETAIPDVTSVCQIGVVRVERGKVIDRRCELVRTPAPKFDFTHIHGITWEMVKDKDPFADTWPLFAPLVDGVEFFAAHNAAFDSRVLAACCKAARIDAPKVAWVCTVKEAKAKWREKANDLKTCSLRVGWTMASHHDALSDAEACAAVLMGAHGGKLDTLPTMAQLLGGLV